MSCFRPRRLLRSTSSECPNGDNSRIYRADGNAMESSKTAVARAEGRASATRKSLKKTKDLRIGDLVLVKRTQRLMGRADPKGPLAPPNLGPFKIIARITENTYKLDLPRKFSRLHNAFHTGLPADLCHTGAVPAPPPEPCRHPP